MSSLRRLPPRQASGAAAHCLARRRRLQAGVTAAPSLRRQQAAQHAQSPREQVLREIQEASRCVAPGLERLVGPIEPEAEHPITLALDGADPPQEPPHLQLGEQKNLRGPPRAKLTLLGCINCRIQRHQAEEVGFWGAVEVVEPGVGTGTVA